MAAWRLLWLVAALILPSGCRSSDKSMLASDLASQGSESTAGSKAQTPPSPCAEKPKDTACCEALTPACNECREENRRRLESWQQHCLQDSQPIASCQSGPPIVECCLGNSSECRDCREQGLTMLMEWKKRCADIEAYSCDKKPALSVCCEALIPSCEVCKERNERVLLEWKRRCG